MTNLAQAAADKMAHVGKIVDPDFQNARPNTFIVAMRLSGSTMINEYAFLLGESKYFSISKF